MSDPVHGSGRYIAVAPTYNNAGYVSGVAHKILAQGVDLLIVNDGSTDSTASVLSDLATTFPDRITVESHARNLGKAAALQTGFARANKLHFTHAITVDTDGQHDPADMDALIAKSRAIPDALVLGCRPITTANYPAKSRAGRRVSNLLVYLLGGHRVSDSQCGMRVYPIKAVLALDARATRYGYETEVLIRAGWAGIEVAEVPIQCIYEPQHAHLSHFRPWRDSVAAVAMHARLLTHSLLPKAAPAQMTPDDGSDIGTIASRLLRWINPFRTWRRLRFDKGERERVAHSVGWGVFMAYQPYFGLKTVICLVLARLLRLQPLVVIGTSSICTPPMGVLLWTMSIFVGHLMMHGSLPTLNQYPFHSAKLLPVLREVGLEWVLGALICGSVLGVLSSLLTRRAIMRIPVVVPAPQQA